MVDVWDFSFRELRFDLAPTVLYESIKKKSFILKKTVNIFFVAIQYWLILYIQLWYCKVTPRVCACGHSAKSSFSPWNSGMALPSWHEKASIPWKGIKIYQRELQGLGWSLWRKLYPELNVYIPSWHALEHMRRKYTLRVGSQRSPSTDCASADHPWAGDAESCSSPRVTGCSTRKGSLPSVAPVLGPVDGMGLWSLQHDSIVSLSTQLAGWLSIDW